MRWCRNEAEREHMSNAYMCTIVGRQAIDAGLFQVASDALNQVSLSSSSTPSHPCALCVFPFPHSIRFGLSTVSSPSLSQLCCCAPKCDSIITNPDREPQPDKKYNGAASSSSISDPHTYTTAHSANESASDLKSATGRLQFLSSTTLVHTLQPLFLPATVLQLERAPAPVRMS